MRMAAKRGKEHRTPILKVSKCKRVPCSVTKMKHSKAENKPTMNRKRSRPPLKEPKKETEGSKKIERKPITKKRKSIFDDSLLKKKKIANGNHKITDCANGNSIFRNQELGLVALHKMNRNGATCGKSNQMISSKKYPFGMLKSATFHPPPKKELANGNSTVAQSKGPLAKSKSSLKTDFGHSFSPKNSSTNSKLTSSLVPFKGPVSNELFKFHTKEAPKFGSKEPLKPMFNDSFKSLATEHVNKITSSNSSKDSTNSTSFNLFGSQPKELAKSQIKDVTKSSAKPSKKEVTKSLVKPSFFKLHPHRMASLDALARMHVLCTTDRRPSEPKHSTSSVTHQKSITQRIQVDVKKETKGSLLHKQEFNLKQQVFVSHSSIVEHEQSATISARVLPGKDKTAAERKAGKDRKKQVDSVTKKSSAHPKLEKVKCVSAKIKTNNRRNNPKLSNKSQASKKTAKHKSDTKGPKKKSKKVGHEKEVKVKETIRMHKTCTYQSVTTVNGPSSSSNAPLNHLGLATNFSKAKDGDQQCKRNVKFSSGSMIDKSYCLTTNSACSGGCCSNHPHANQKIPFAHMQNCSIQQQQPFVMPSPAADCSCCCSSPLMQSILRPCCKTLLPYEQPLLTGCCAVHHLCSHCNIPAKRASPSNLVPSEQSPLDLSLTSGINLDSVVSLQPPAHCPCPGCYRRPADLLLLRTSTHHGFHCQNPVKPMMRHFSTASSGQACCGCSSSICSCSADAVQSFSCSSSVLGPLPDCNVSQASLPLDANKKLLCCASAGSLLTAKQEILPKHISNTKKRRLFTHGWSWRGKPTEKLITLTNDSVPCTRTCYASIQHQEGDVIHERDCVLLKSGPKETDLPYVAKVAGFWENPEDGEMMMSLLWYYRPEHTEQGRKPGQMEDEVFASRHKDINSVACIEDKCYVLTFNEYCRYKASLSMEDEMSSLSFRVVPPLSDGHARQSRLPLELVAQDIVFFCCQVYDFRQKRILKNPS